MRSLSLYVDFVLGEDLGLPRKYNLSVSQKTNKLKKRKNMEGPV